MSIAINPIIISATLREYRDQRLQAEVGDSGPDDGVRRNTGQGSRVEEDWKEEGKSAGKGKEEGKGTKSCEMPNWPDLLEETHIQRVDGFEMCWPGVEISLTSCGSSLHHIIMI